MLGCIGLNCYITFLSSTVVVHFDYINRQMIAELAEHSPIKLYKIVVTHQAEKIWMYDHTTVQGATFNMCGQLYQRHANATALFSSPVVSALGSELDDLGSSPGWGKALCP